MAPCGRYLPGRRGTLSLTVTNFHVPDARRTALWASAWSPAWPPVPRPNGVHVRPRAWPARLTDIRLCEVSALGRPTRAIGPPDEDPVHGAGQHGDGDSAGLLGYPRMSPGLTPCRSAPNARTSGPKYALRHRVTVKARPRAHDRCSAASARPGAERQGLNTGGRGPGDCGIGGHDDIGNNRVQAHGPGTARKAAATG